MVQASRFYTLVLFNGHRFYLEAVKTELKIKCLPLADLLPLQWHLDLDLYQNDKFKYHHHLEEYIYLWNNFGPSSYHQVHTVWSLDSRTDECQSHSQQQNWHFNLSCRAKFSLIYIWPCIQLDIGILSIRSPLQSPIIIWCPFCPPFEWWIKVPVSDNVM